MVLLKALKHAIILGGLILTGSMASSAFGQTTLKAGGSVTDEGGAPFVKAQVSLYSPDRILQTTSDAAGHFQFDRIPFGVYELEVASPSFKTKMVEDVRVTAATRNEDLQFNVVLKIGDLNADCLRHDRVSYGLAKAEEGNSIIGAVFRFPQREKVPVANARVSLLSNQGVKLDEQITNERGEFQFKPIVPGRYLIEMKHPSFNSVRSTVFWTARENRTYLIFEPVPNGMMIACQ